MESDPVLGQIDNSVKSGIKIQPPGRQDTASGTKQLCLPSLHLLFFLIYQDTFIKRLHVTQL